MYTTAVPSATLNTGKFLADSGSSRVELVNVSGEVLVNNFAARSWSTFLQNTINIPFGKRQIFPSGVRKHSLALHVLLTRSPCIVRYDTFTPPPTISILPTIRGTNRSGIVAASVSRERALVIVNRVRSVVSNPEVTPQVTMVTELATDSPIREYLEIVREKRSVRIVWADRWVTVVLLLELCVLGAAAAVEKFLVEVAVGVAEKYLVELGADEKCFKEFGVVAAEKCFKELGVACFVTVNEERYVLEIN
eukprot:sb/3468776/